MFLMLQIPKLVVLLSANKRALPVLHTYSYNETLGLYAVTNRQNWKP